MDFDVSMDVVFVPADSVQPARVVRMPHCAHNTTGFLEETYKLLGTEPGGLDSAWIGRDLRVWVDDVGAYSKNVNMRATALRARMIRRLGKEPSMAQMPLFGDLIVMGPVVGENESPTPEWLIKLVQLGNFDEWVAA